MFKLKIKRFVIKDLLEIKKSNFNPKDFNYEKNPEFGTVVVPRLLKFELSKSNNTPSKILIEDYKNLEISPFCASLHYGQTIFEGLKAYRLENDEIGIFRLEDHAIRFSKSAQIMGMCPFPPELFIESVKEFINDCREYVPREENHSFYLRPLLFANDSKIKVNSSQKYQFIIMASIVGSYFNSGSVGTRVLINKQFVRAFPGGTGEAKTAANYSLSLNALEYAKKNDFEQVLYLDALTKTKFEELGGMNFFMVKNGSLITPKLSGQILHGVTRASIIQIAKDLGIGCLEEIINLEDFLNAYNNKECDEIFATGTAATINPIALLGVQNNFNEPIKRLEFSQTKIASALRLHLQKTHRNKTEQSKNWLTII